MTISKYSICIVLHHFHLVYIVYTINTISKHILPEPEELKTRLINVSTIHNKWRHYSSRNFDLFFHICVNFDKNLWIWMSMIQQNSKKIHTSNFITNRRLTFRYFQFCTNSLKLSHGIVNIEIQYWNSPIELHVFLHVEIVMAKYLIT